ncbi:flagellin, partial [Campylobacter coli]
GSGNSKFAALKTTAANTTDETAGVTTLKGAMAVMDIAETAITNLDQIRADIGSVQNQLQVTINNITVTQVNVKSAESNIRDVDFASESANFSKYNILAQSGSYAMSQANAVQQNVLKLLQ